MLGSLGFFASRGMTTVPDIVNMTKTAAESSLIAAGLTVGTRTSVSTSTSADNNKIKDQSLPLGSVVDYDTVINFSYYTYVSSPSPTPAPTPVPTCTNAQNQRFLTSWSGNCVNGIEEGTYVIETCYDNCPCITNTYTETRSCTPPAPCTGSSQQTYPTNWSGNCINGSESGTIITETSYTNCASTTTTTYTSRSCSTPAPTPAPTTPGTYNPTFGGNYAPGAYPPGTPIAVACIDQDTMIIKVDLDGTKTNVKASEISVGDYVLSMKWDELVDQSMNNYFFSTSTQLTNPVVLPTLIVAKREYQKNTTIYFNNDISTRMSLEQPILVYRDGEWIWTSTGDIYVTDKVIRYTEDGYTVEETITAVDYISELRDVYSFDCEDTDTFFAGNLLVHNK